MIKNKKHFCVLIYSYETGFMNSKGVYKMDHMYCKTQWIVISSSINETVSVKFQETY